MPFCYYYVFVIKCLSLIAGCNPGSPFQSCIPVLKAAGFWATQRDMDAELNSGVAQRGRTDF